MKGVIKGLGDKSTYWINGKQVSREVFLEAFPPKPIGNGEGLIGWKHPVESLSLAVKKKDIAKARMRDLRHGVPTEYTSDGSPIIRSTAHQRALAKSLGMHQNNCFY